MKKLLGLTLGIMTALGGFLDLGQIVFTFQAGALFQYQLLWAVLLGMVAIILYMEMCGRVAVVTGRPVFTTVRQQLGPKLGFVTLVASNLLNLITCAAELAGVAIILHLLTGWPERPLLIGVALVFLAIVLLLQFEWIERTFGLTGLMMIVFGVAAFESHPVWSEVVIGFLPYHRADASSNLLFAYFAVGIFSAMLMEYEVHFYSSGAIEEKWKTKDLDENFMVASVGSILGALLTVGLLILGAQVFLPRNIFPEAITTTVMPAALILGKKAMLLACAGIAACLSGAAIETALSAGYNICQFYELPWGKNKPIKSVPIFTGAFCMTLILAVLIGFSGVRPLKLVEISVVFGMVVMPLTYYPILRVAADKKTMGQHANSSLVNFLGVTFLVLIALAAIVAVPLMIVTNSGQP
jgi:manganese transport protein